MRLFIHPTRDCNLSCSGCYLTDIPGIEDLLKAELPLSYFENILESAATAGFDELALLINPQSKVAEQMQLAEMAKELQMTVNMTTTHQVILGMTHPLHQVDIMSMSVDTERFKDPTRALRYVQKVSEHLNSIGWSGYFNINLTYSVEVFDWVKDATFINQLYYYADSIAHLMMKPIEQYYGSYERFEDLFDEALNLDHLDITGTKSVRDIGEPCVYHMAGLQNCFAGYEELSIDPNGKISGCVFDEHTTDVSSVEKFDNYIERWLETRAPVQHCRLVQ